MSKPNATERSAQRRAALGLYWVLALSASACLTEVRILDSNAAGAGGGGGVGGGSTNPQDCADASDRSRCRPPLWNGPSGAAGDGASATGSADSPLCKRGGRCGEIDLVNYDKLDLLFVIDNSEGMREEQESLRREFPRLLRVLATGDRDQDGVPDQPAVKDLNLAVASTDLGIGAQAEPQGISAQCTALGDDAVFRNVPSPELAGCQAAYPRFLRYADDFDDVARTAVDLACIATLGTDGCGFEQPLEAALKALWPSIDPNDFLGEPRFTFVGDGQGASTLGQGDMSNRDFLRNDPIDGQSIISVVVVTDEDDCSTTDPRLFLTADQLAIDDPLRTQPLNLRCHESRHLLTDVERYVEGLRALRPGREDLVFFNVIAGVPEDLVEVSLHSGFELTDREAREAYYDRILQDPRMAVRVVPTVNAALAEIAPSCETASGLAYPPRRLVEVARGFGENGLVQSICDPDLGPAIGAIAEQIGRKTGAPCLNTPLVRQESGAVACDLLWELPLPGQAPASTPSACRQLGFLKSDPERESLGGGEVCRVTQLPVVTSGGDPVVLPTHSSGWYYDDFSDETTQDCLSDRRQRIAFTPDAKPPTGVRVILDCDRAAVQRMP